MFVGFSTSNEWTDVRVYAVFVPPACFQWKQKSGCMKHIYVANNKHATENSNPNSISNSFSLNRKNGAQNYNSHLLLFFYLKASLL